MQHFYDSFALVSQIRVRRDALALFGLNDDELLPDLHITRAGVLRAGIEAHQEHVVHQDAQAADTKKVPAEVIQVASYEVDPIQTRTSPSLPLVALKGAKVRVNRSKNDPPSSLASDAACKPPILQ